MTADAERPFAFPSDVGQRVDAFLEAAWPSLAGAAWRFYMQRGRGAPVIPWQHVDAIVNGTRAVLSPAFFGDHDDPAIQQAIDLYDPNTSAVLMFVGERDFAANASTTEGGTGLVFGAMYYRVVIMAPSPPDAHARRGN